jgi:hypothetical protein
MAYPDSCVSGSGKRIKAVGVTGRITGYAEVIPGDAICVILGSEEARSRAGLRPPPKLPVHISCRQLSRRLSNAERQEKELSRSDVPARTRRKAGS